MEQEGGLGLFSAIDPEAERIELAGDGLDDAAIPRLAALLQSNTSATVLDLSGNYIGDAGACHLAQALQCSTALTVVDLSGNPIGDAGALALAEAVQHCPALQTLDLAGTQASLVAVERVRAAFAERVATTAAHLSVEEFRRQLERLDDGCSDPSDTLFEKFDLALELLAQGPAQALCAITTLEALIADSRPRDVMDLHSLLLAHLSRTPAASEVAGLTRLLGTTLQRFTKHEEREWPPCFDMVARALKERATVQDNRPEVVCVQSENQQAAVPRMAGSAVLPGDFYRHHRAAYIDFAGAMAEGVEQRPWAHREMLLRLCFHLLRAEVCSRVWPAAQSTASMGLPALLPDALRQLTAEVMMDVQPLVDLVAKTGVSAHFLLESAANADATPSRAPASEGDSGDDFSDFEDDLDERELQGSDYQPTPWDKAGVAVFCLAVRTGSPPPPMALVPAEYTLRSHLPGLQALLATANLTAAHLALCLCDELLATVPKYGVRIFETVGPREGGEAKEAALEAKDVQKGEFSTTSAHFEAYFAFAQDLGTLMALCPSQGHRGHAHGCLLALLARFAERTRHKLLIAFLKLCPYKPVKALVLTLLKDEIRAEYTALEAVLQELPPDHSRPDAIARFSRSSAFLHPGTTQLLCDTMAADAEHWRDNVDTLMAALNLLRFLLVVDARYPCMGVTSSAQQAALCRQVLDPLTRVLESGGAAMGTDAQVLGDWMLLEVVGAIREKLRSGSCS